MAKDNLINIFEDLGYYNVEIIGDRILFTTGGDVFNWGIDEAVRFLQNQQDVNLTTW